MQKPAGPDEPVIVCGRSLSDYALCGVPVPPDVILHRCVGCGTLVAITAEAQAKLDTPGTAIRAAICTPCAKSLFSGKGDQMHVFMTRHGAGQVSSSVRARKTLDGLLDSFDK